MRTTVAPRKWLVWAVILLGGIGAALAHDLEQVSALRVSNYTGYVIDSDALVTTKGYNLGLVSRICG